jgi:hypothetical protein
VYEYNPWGKPSTTIPFPDYTPPTYEFPTTSPGRWKCPDCKGWVVNWVPVHHCTATINTTTNTYITNNAASTSNKAEFVKSVN